MLTRAEIQNQIDIFKKGHPDLNLYELKVLMKDWLDQTDLSMDNLSHEFMRDRILDDLNSYEGVKE